MSAPVASHSSESELTAEILCARKALATSLDNSADQTLAVMMFSLGTHRPYTDARASIAERPSWVWGPPIRTRSGFVRSSTAVPSAKNSGLESTWKLTPGGAFSVSTQVMASAVDTGTVLFSTTILLPLKSLVSPVRAALMERAAPSQYVRSAALPFPNPYSLVGVLTATKMISASLTAETMSVLKKRFLPLTSLTISSSPGSKMGRSSLFQALILCWLRSTTVTFSPVLSAIMAIVGPPT
mmetsp:Transcript_41906/g.65492  ORF Transcript_41906/g.65492 Transcript_41906/m.65492 type:complete len:241 (+) Transcript_41906:761-1483(+)